MEPPMPVHASSRQPVSGIRTLPIRVAPVAGEALDSWLEAVAQRCAVSFVDVLSAHGFTRTDRWPGWWLSLPDHDIDHVAAAAGVDPAVIRAMTVERYRCDVRRRDEQRHRVDGALWVRRGNSRFCPDCLRETGGRWQVAWRLTWSFACVKHGCLLADRCPGCASAQRCRAAHARDIPPPGHRCRGLALPPPACTADLTRTDVLLLYGAHSVLDTQRAVDDLLDDQPLHLAVYRGASPSCGRMLRDVKLLTQWIFTSVAQNEIDRHLPADIGAAVAQHRRSTGWPHGVAWRSARTMPSALDTAAGVVIALKILAVKNVSAATAMFEQLMASSSTGPYRAPISHRSGLSPAVGAIHDHAYAVIRADQKLKSRLARAAAAPSSVAATSSNVR
jgi:TniQ